MAAPMKTSMPDSVDIGSGYTLRIAAQAAVDGSTVAGVNISNFVIEATAVGQGDLSFGLFKLVPGAGA
jgi:hypothetical protein